jgi:hypothetical protein
MEIERMSTTSANFGIRLTMESRFGDTMDTGTARRLAASIIEACDAEDAHRDSLMDILATAHAARKDEN